MLRLYATQCVGMVVILSNRSCCSYLVAYVVVAVWRFTQAIPMLSLFLHDHPLHIQTAKNWEEPHILYLSTTITYLSSVPLYPKIFASSCAFNLFAVKKIFLGRFWFWMKCIRGFSCVLFFIVSVSHEWIYFRNGNKCCPMWKLYTNIFVPCVLLAERIWKVVTYF